MAESITIFERMTETPFNLTEKTALITGGADGIGLGIAQQFIQLGARVLITGRTLASLQEAQKKLGGQCHIFQNDVTDKSAHPALIAHAAKTLGHLDILVNNAGRHMKKPAVDVTNEEFEQVIDINLNSVFSLTKAALPHMIGRGSGSVIFISSMAALYGLPKVVAYSSSKTALLGLARSFAAEYSAQGIRFNTIAPGFIESKMFLNAVQDDPARKARILARTPSGTFGKPEHIGHAAAFLASDASVFITGVCLPVDGGNAIGF